MDQSLTKEGKDTKMFPDSSASDFRIMCHALSTDFLVYASDVSYLKYINIYEHSKRFIYIRDIFRWVI